MHTATAWSRTRLCLQAAPADYEAMRRAHQFQQLAILQEEHQARLLDVLAGLDASASSLPPEPEPPSPPPVSGLERSFADFGLDELRHVFPSHSTAQLQQTLADCGGDVNRAAARLLAD